MENVEVGIFDPTTVKIRRGIGLGIKWGGILGFTLVSSTDQVSLFINSSEANIFCNFRLVLLVKKDKRVMTSVAGVKESLSSAWVGRVV